MGAKHRRSDNRHDLGVSPCPGGQATGAGRARRAVDGFFVVTTTVVAVPGVSYGEMAASNRHRCLDIVPGPARRRGHAETEIGQYRQQYDGAQRDHQVVLPGGRWLWTSWRHDAVIPHFFADSIENQLTV